MKNFLETFIFIKKNLPRNYYFYKRKGWSEYFIFVLLQIHVQNLKYNNLLFTKGR